jgi:serine phosphatase RsbU (regulator of sigma subunit)
VRWEPSVVALPDGWTLVFFTDGLVEGRAAPATDERFGVERLQGLFAGEFAAGPADLDAALERVVMAIVTANGGPLPDDVALVVVTSRPGVPAPGPV